MFFTTDPTSRWLLASCGMVVKALAVVALGDR